MAPPDSLVFRRNLNRILAIFTDLGVPLATNKLEGPAKHLIFLGTKLDTQAGIMCLPKDKLLHLKDLLEYVQDIYPLSSCHLPIVWFSCKPLPHGAAPLPCTCASVNCNIRVAPPKKL